MARTPKKTSRLWRLFDIVQLLLVKPRLRAELQRALEASGHDVSATTLSEDLAELADAGWVETPGSGSRERVYRLNPKSVPLLLPAEDALFLRQALQIAGPAANVLTKRLKEVLGRVPKSVVKHRKARVWRPHDPRLTKETDPAILICLMEPLAKRYQFSFLYASKVRGERLWYKAVAARFTNVDGPLCILAYVPDDPTRDPEGLKPVKRRGDAVVREFRVDFIADVRVISPSLPVAMEWDKLETCRFLYLVTEAFLKRWQPPEGHVVLDPASVGGLVCPPACKVFLGESVSAFRAVRWLVEKGGQVWVPDLPAGSFPRAPETGRVREDLLRHLADISARYGTVVPENS
ncbi:MAG: hypothetical protein VKP57_10595 [Candidatus Sericytochromatia bacterium]|nr:hypothetical protein [Candidatus Sericytochromatia bacterium]